MSAPTSLLRSLALVAALVLAPALVACGGGSDDDASGESGSADPAGTPAGGDDAPTLSLGSTPPADPGAVIARVNGSEIFARDLERVITNLSRQGIPPEEGIEGDTPEEKIRNTAVKLLVEQMVVLHAAEAESITADDNQVLTQLSQVKIQAGGDANFQQFLASMGVSEDEVTRDIRNNLIIREYFTGKVNPSPEVSEDEIRAFFDENSDQFGPKPEVQASHILLMIQPGMDDMAKAELRTRTEAILREIREGADFAETARTKSEDQTTAPNGGQLGWFGKERMVPPFADAAFALDPGEVSDVVETQFGYHIIQVTDRRTTPGRAFDEVKTGLEGMVRQQKVTDTSQALVDELRSKAKIEIL